jgi:hypothetical protein
MGPRYGGHFAKGVLMLSNQSFDEIRVFEGVAERTGVRFERDAVRRSAGCCKSLSELMRKARASGDGVFYLPLNLWPADTEKIDIQKRWLVMSSIPE